MNRRLYFVLVVIAVLVAAGLLTRQLWQAPEPSQGQILYDKHCAVCHGATGDGQGEAAYLLLPKPRNFRAGMFRLVSSHLLQPTRDDLFRTITAGMPGTAMPSWNHLAGDDRWALSDYVLELNRGGWFERGIESGYSAAEAEKFAAEMTDPGEPISIPPEPPVSRQGLRQGRQFYLTACANCHGENGEGRQDPTWRTAEGFPTWSRELREGVFKGGREGEQLFLRFFTGLPGTPMPSGILSDEGVWRVVQYVQSLSDPASQEEAQIRTQEIVAQRVEKLPSDPDDAAWEAAPEIRVPLMPLWWREGYINAVWVKALHDGERLAFSLRWNDPTGDVEGIRQQSFPDGAAVQLTASESPPLFAMGAAGEAVNIWHWKALWPEDQKGFRDVGTAFPGMVTDGYFGAEKGWQADPLEDTRFLPAVEVRNLIASQERPSVVEDANAAGLGTITSQAHAQQNVEGVSRWKEGVWRLLLTRTMEAAEGEDVPLSPARPASIAFALWDGSAGDRNGQKSVSIWNTLRME